MMARFTSMILSVEPNNIDFWSPQLRFIMRFTAFLKCCEPQQINLFMSSLILLVPTTITAQNYINQIMPLGVAPDNGVLTDHQDTWTRT